MTVSIFCQASARTGKVFSPRPHCLAPVSVTCAVLGTVMPYYTSNTTTDPSPKRSGGRQEEDGKVERQLSAVCRKVSMSFIRGEIMRHGDHFAKAFLAV